MLVKWIKSQRIQKKIMFNKIKEDMNKQLNELKETINKVKEIGRQSSIQKRNSTNI
jgi:hypothetical protein